MTDPRPTRALIRCDGAAVPAELAQQPWDVREDVTAMGGDPDLTLVVDNLMAKVTGEIDHRVRDLIRIAAYCFAADREVRRGGAVDVHREGWCRELVLCISVTDPTFWSAPEVVERLTQALGFGTGDRWSFAFDQAGPAMGQIPIRWAPRLPSDGAEGTAVFGARPEAVVLFSGGTDSLCTLVDTLRDRPAPPIVVSHWPARHIKARQDRLLLDVRRRFERWDLPHVSFEIHRAGGGDGESSQRARGFLFACLGAAVAAHAGAGEVLLADNGYVSVNPPINDQLVGTLASRGTHPTFLSLINRLLDRLFGGAVRVANPLWDRTRAEALGVLVTMGCPDLLTLTHSCGKHRGRVVGKPHCGYCSQCVDRRFATTAAGLEAFDPPDRYELDLFADDLPKGDARTVALSYVRFADEVHRTDPDALFDAYPELDTCLDPDDPGFGAQSIGIADVLKRHATEVLGVVGRMYGEQGPGLARRELPEHALLRLWAGPDGWPVDGQAATAYGVEARPRHSRFLRSGAVWLIDFRDEEGGLKDRAGTRRLARLLREAGHDLEALDLVSGTAAENEGARRPAGGRAPETWRTSGPGDAGLVLDEATVEDYMRRLDDLAQQIRTAEAGGDAAWAGHLRHEQDWLQAQLRAGVGKGGRLRRLPEEHERARSTVSKTIWEQIDELGTTMPILHAHLRRWIRLGYLCWYDPTPPEPWDVAS